MVAVLGGLLTLAGIAPLVLPGPGFVLVAAGLAVLTTRFSWAKKPLDYAKDKAQQGVEEVAKKPWRAAGAVLAALALVVLGGLALAGVDLLIASTPLSSKPKPTTELRTCSQMASKFSLVRSTSAWSAGPFPDGTQYCGERWRTVR